VVLYEMVFGVTLCHVLSHKRAISKLVNVCVSISQHEFEMPPETKPCLARLLQKVLRKNSAMRVTISEVLEEI
jgi:hypothetical protein